MKDAGLVGQIHACPRCGAMVLLAPVGDAAPPAAAAASTPSRPAPAPNPTTISNLAAAVAAEREFADVASLGLDAPPAVDAEQPSGCEGADAGAATGSPTSGGAVLPLALAGATLLGGVALGAYLLLAGGAANAPAPSSPPDRTEAFERTASKPVVAGNPEGVAPSPSPAAPDGLGGAGERGGAQGQEEPNVVKDAPLRDTRIQSEPADVATTASPPAQVTPPAAARSGVPPGGPPLQATEEAAGETAEGLVLVRDVGADAPAEGADSPAEGPGAALPELSPNPPPVRERLAALDRQLAARGAGERVMVETGPTGPPPEPLDLDALLSAAPPNVRLVEAPLWSGIDVWSRLAGAPVTIPPASLARAARSPLAKLTLAGHNASYRDLLQRALAPHKLGVEQGPYGLTLVRLGQETPRDAEYPIDDLVVHDPDALVGLIERMTPSLATTGTRVEAHGGVLRVSGPVAAHLDVAVFAERLRKARGLAARSRYPAGLLRVRPALETLLPRLNKPVTFSFVEPTPLGDVVDHWRVASGVVVLVDWVGLAEQGVTRATTLRCSTAGEPLADAMDAVLSRLGLGWVPAGDDAIQITTLDRAGAEPWVDFYASPDGSAGLMERAAAAAGEGADVAFDPPSRSILVSAPAGAHRRVYRVWSDAGDP